MKFKNLALLVPTVLASVNAVLNEKNCTGHPDPHFRNFNGLPFDFQDGCDVVLAKNPNPNIEIHARLTMMGGYSAVQSVGAKIGSQVVLIDSGSASIDGIPQTSFPVNLGSAGYSLDYLRGTANNPLGSDYIIRFPEGSLQVGNNIGEADGGRKLMKGSSMSFKIHGVESVFEESVGLCGDWSANNNDGTYGRNGALLNLPPLYPNSVWNYDGTDLGHSWRVDPAQGDDDSILADATIPDGSQWNDGTCVPNGFNSNGMRKRRLAQGATCAICEALANPVQQEICNYDADVLGCNFVQSVLGKYYKNDSPWFADMGDVYDNLKCADVAQRQRKWRRGGKDPEDVRALQRDENRDKWRTERCRRMGGECVVMCNPVDGEYDCKTGLCYIPIKVKWVADILVNRKFYPQCSCKIPVKKETPRA